MTTSTSPNQERSLWLVSGAAAAIGGTLAVLAACLLALEPPGCVLAECNTRSMRTAPPLITALGMAAAGLILAGWGGIVLIARRAGARTRSLITGFALAAGGPALIVVFVAIQDWYFSGDLPWMPVVVGVGLLCIVAGLATLLWTVVRAGVLPRWLGIVVVVSVVPGVLFNDQNAAVLLIVPFGLAMLLVGVVTYVSGAGSRKTAGAASLAHD